MKNIQRRRRHLRTGREGVSIIAVAMLVVVAAGLSVALLAGVKASSGEQHGSREGLSSMYACEAAFAEAVMDLATGGTGDIGSAQNPATMGDGNAFWVQATDLGSNMTSLIATGRSARTVTRAEVVVRPAAVSQFQWAAFGDEELTMDSNARVDSYDSTAGTYESQQVNGSGSDAYANSNGNVGSNGDIGMRQNSTVYGNAQPGESSTITIVGNASVSGVTAPLIDPHPMPPLVIPNLPLLGDFIVSGPQPPLAAGDYHFGEFRVESSDMVVIEGPATLVLESMELQSNSRLLVDSSNGPVDIYVIEDFVLSSNTLVASNSLSPLDITIYLNSDNIIDPGVPVDLDEVDFESNAKMYGTIYAPNASIEINSNFELFGGIIAKRMHLDSNSLIHYDEALSRAGTNGSNEYETLMWRVLSSTEP